MAGLTPQQIQQVKSTPFVYDRFRMLVDGIEYLPNGFLRNFRVSVPFRSRVVAGMSRTGAGVALLVGGYDVAYAWDELLGNAAEFINWRIFLLSNPGVTFTIIPITVDNANAPAAPQFTLFGGTVIGEVSITQPGESVEAMQSLVFSSTECAGLTI